MSGKYVRISQKLNMIRRHFFRRIRRFTYIFFPKNLKILIMQKCYFFHQNSCDNFCGFKKEIRTLSTCSIKNERLAITTAVFWGITYYGLILGLRLFLS